MSSEALRRHAPLLVFAICVAAMIWVVERQHYSANTASTLEIFGAIVLGMIILRNYTGPASFNSDLPKVAGVITAVALALAFAVLVVVVIIPTLQ